MEDNSPEPIEWQRVAKLARYEQPPPGFHRGLRNKIRSRIAEIESQRALPWWRRLARPITGRPALIWANAVTFVGACFVGLGLYEAAKVPPRDPNLASDRNNPSLNGFGSSMDLEGPFRLLVPPVSTSVSFTYDSTNPIPAGLFHSPSAWQAMPASQLIYNAHPAQ
jgi:hypothetical protein